MTSLSYCGEMVRKHDPDRFLLSLYEPAAQREALFALYAFNHEIAKTREVVTETQLGLIRLQWWRDALSGYYERGDVLKHQGLEPLCAAIKAHDLPREDLDNLIYAREFDLEDRLPANLEGMVKYAAYTNAPLISLGLKVLGQTATPEQVQAIAAAYGLTGLLRAAPVHLRQHRCYLPEDLIHRQEMSVYDLYDGSAIQKLPPVTRAVWQEADRQLQSLHAAPKPLRRMAKLTRLYLGQIKSADFDVFSPRLSMPPLLREIRLLFN
jgi:NADH dehydrogenase [ubiquinone] 1 alpha subcomplex assembly factor 6